MQNENQQSAWLGLGEGLGPTRQQVNAWMADAGWQNSAIRQADLDKVERLVRVAVAAERERCAQIVEGVQGWEGVRDVAARIRGA